jgi:hypothetical protein
MVAYTLNSILTVFDFTTGIIYYKTFQMFFVGYCISTVACYDAKNHELGKIMLQGKENEFIPF